MSFAQLDSARSHYRRHAEKILAPPASQWAIDPYAWEHEAGLILTPIERALWSDIRFVGAVLYPQVPVGRFFVDFGNPVAKVAIECDGAAWHTDKRADMTRQSAIEARGWAVYRLTGSACAQSDGYGTDEDGNERYVESPSTKLIRELCRRHGIRVGGH